MKTKRWAVILLVVWWFMPQTVLALDAEGLSKKAEKSGAVLVVKDKVEECKKLDCGGSSEDTCSAYLDPPKLDSTGNYYCLKKYFRCYCKDTTCQQAVVKNESGKIIVDNPDYKKLVADCEACGAGKSSSSFSGGETVDIIVGSCSSAKSTGPVATSTVPFQPVVPKLSIKIPGLDFSKIKIALPDENGYIYIPFVGMYINSIYQFALVIASVLAVIVIIIGGVKYIMSGGSADQITSAKKMMAGAMAGLVLAYVSYMVLYTINPDLVNLNTLKIQTVAPEELPEQGYNDTDPGTGKELGNSVYDEMFQKFSGCIGINWKVMKGMAWGESRLNPKAANPASSARGLFQIFYYWCEKSRGLKSVGWDKYCSSPGILNPALNTALDTKMFLEPALKKIQSVCPGVSARDGVFMTYYFNASPSRMKKAISTYGCDTGKWVADASGLGLFKTGPANFVKRIDKIMTMGLGQYFGPVDKGQCPFNTGATPASFPN